MITTKLILIEGLPGTGKTSLAEFLSSKLDQSGISHQCYYEESTINPARASWDEDPEIFIKLSLETWKEFTQETMKMPGITIIEGMLFQCTPRLLLQQNMAQDRIQKYIEQVDNLIEPLNPRLIYLEKGDVASSIKQICLQRGPIWEEYFVQAVTENAYGYHRRLKGFDGAIVFMEDYQNLCENMLGQIEMTKISVDVREAKWNQSNQEIMSFLEL